MIYRFGGFELDPATAELRVDGIARHLEPQVYALLLLLVENRDRLVSRDEIIEKIWSGRPVSDAAVASRVKSARRALGDDGSTQRYIRTAHGQGFRFVASATPVQGRAATAPASTPVDESGRNAATQHVHDLGRPSLAVLPFRAVGVDERAGLLASALPAELIADLARMRWLFVTARGSSFRLRPDETPVGEIGRLLGVRYGLLGTVEASSHKLVVTVELVDTRDDGIVWADRFESRLDDVHVIREQIRARVVASLDVRIPLHEAELARYTAPEHLDAWSAFHLGLQHLYRFNRGDNAAAARLFERAVALDPRFARGYAGLSFAHFQSAFMHYAGDLEGAAESARRCAQRGLELEPLDPFVNFTMGRSYWLVGDLETSLAWLERATAVSPNYAHGIYALAWTEALSGRSAASRDHVDLSMRLSPIDQLYYAMLATRAFTHMAESENAEAAAWAERAARSLGAHPLISMVAAAAHAMCGEMQKAKVWAQDVRERQPALTKDDFFRAFPTKTEPMRGQMLQVLTALGF